ncbi:MAG TPA: hypothetical protein VIK72_02925 [Clostridiaceae bacterium]
MIQFTKQEIKSLKLKAESQNWIISWLQKEVRDLMDNGIQKAMKTLV